MRPRTRLTPYEHLYGPFVRARWKTHDGGPAPSLYKIHTHDREGVEEKTILRAVDRKRLIMSILQKPAAAPGGGDGDGGGDAKAAGGANLNIARLVNSKKIDSFFCLHNRDKLGRLEAEWTSFCPRLRRRRPDQGQEQQRPRRRRRGVFCCSGGGCCGCCGCFDRWACTWGGAGADDPPSRHMAYEASLDRLKDYYGEKLGLYFAFTMHYTRWMIVPALVGLFIKAHQFMYDSTTRVLLPNANDAARAYDVDHDGFLTDAQWADLVASNRTQYESYYHQHHQQHHQQLWAIHECCILMH